MPNKHTILIVDDEVMIREAVTRAMRRENYEIHCAENDRERVEKCNAVHPEVILLDINMPVMNGMEMLKTIKQQTTDRFR